MSDQAPDYRFTPAFANPSGSAIRELFKYLSQPGMISFAGGYPAAEFFDRTALRQASEQALRDTPLDCLQYGATEGLPDLREQLAALMVSRGVSTTAHDLVVTTGSQQCFDLLIKVLLNPGDSVLVERPTYPAAVQALRLAGMQMLSAATDAEGLDTEALAAQLADQPRGAIRLLYCVPTFANPTGACLPLARRLKLLELAAQHDFLLVEDDPYGALRFEGEAVASLLQLSLQVPGAAGRVIHLSSLSKVLAPGLRVGWMIAPPAVRQRCLIAKQTSDLCTSPWTQRIAANYLASGALDRALPALVAGYRAKCRTMLAGLQTMTEYLEVAPPAGGMFVWGRCRDGVDAQAVLQRAIKENVLFVPGSAFYAHAPDPSSIRLSFAAPGLEAIEEGLQRLRRAF
ncbi:MAG: PLP-dependent aminotransferase family protein [Janthinobacterium lividum]